MPQKGILKIFDSAPNSFLKALFNLDIQFSFQSAFPATASKWFDCFRQRIAKPSSVWFADFRRRRRNNREPIFNRRRRSLLTAPPRRLVEKREVEEGGCGCGCGCGGGAAAERRR
ncbi:hypothetical protein ACP275_09G065200 [Erythranthe tilingii]